MTLTAAIVLILTADVALIAGLAWMMSRPGKLTPHVHASHDERLPRRHSRIWRAVPAVRRGRSARSSHRDSTRSVSSGA